MGVLCRHCARLIREAKSPTGWAHLTANSAGDLVCCYPGSDTLGPQAAPRTLADRGCINRANPRDPYYRPPAGVDPVWGRAPRPIVWPSREALASYAWWDHHTDPVWSLLDGGTLDLGLKGEP